MSKSRTDQQTITELQSENAKLKQNRLDDESIAKALFEYDYSCCLNNVGAVDETWDTLPDTAENVHDLRYSSTKEHYIKRARYILSLMKPVKVELPERKPILSYLPDSKMIDELIADKANVHLECLDDGVYMLIVETKDHHYHMRVTKKGAWMYEEFDKEYQGEQPNE